MRIARFSTTTTPAQYGIIEGDSIQPLDGCPLTAIKKSGAPLPLAKVKLLAPATPPNLIAIGRNYLEHAKEGNDVAPKAPIVFLKATTAIVGPGDAVVIPETAPNEVDYEAELAVVIGTTARNVSEADALKHVFGYTCANDVSARDCQRNDPQWARGKSFDTFAPLGPWIETELSPANLRVKLILNGAVLQNESSSMMIFNVPYLISYLSKCMTLQPGTVILTGTPAGCGFARKPPVWLKPGDDVVVEIEGIGSLRNTVKAAAR
jgi:2-keto-4-pentenoate hydratase/2-oxohepta-3-ene-1,7-dioic acid hydratase in catechol pathway